MVSRVASPWPRSPPPCVGVPRHPPWLGNVPGAPRSCNLGGTEEAWVELGRTRSRGRRGAPGDAYEGTLPQPVFRQLDVTGHTRTDPPGTAFWSQCTITPFNRPISAKFLWGRL